jgi:hypothetical protein
MTVTNGTNITIDHFKKTVSFVAIKNGEHHGTGYLLSNTNISNGTIPLTDIYHIVKDTVLNPMPG